MYKYYIIFINIGGRKSFGGLEDPSGKENSAASGISNPKLLIDALERCNSV
jgi:hypothetical protein